MSAPELVTSMQAAQMSEAPLAQAKTLIAHTQESFKSVQKKLTHESPLGGLIAGLQAKLNASVPLLDVCLTDSKQILIYLDGLEAQDYNLGKVQ